MHEFSTIDHAEAFALVMGKEIIDSCLRSSRPSFSCASRHFLRASPLTFVSHQHAEQHAKQNMLMCAQPAAPGVER